MKRELGQLGHPFVSKGADEIARVDVLVLDDGAAIRRPTNLPVDYCLLSVVHQANRLGLVLGTGEPGEQPTAHPTQRFPQLEVLSDHHGRLFRAQDLCGLDLSAGVEG